MARAKTEYRVVEIRLLGKRWALKRRWMIWDGPYHREVAGPFTSRRQALDALSELVNESYSREAI